MTKQWSKKGWIITLATMCLLVVLIGVGALQTSATNGTLSGTGTSADPYLIYDEADLAAFRTLVNGGSTGICGKLMADIEMTSTWTPIGTMSSDYTGTFDGNDYTISNLTVTCTTSSSGGLFTSVGSGGVIKNLNITNGSVTGSSNFPYAAGIVGVNEGTVTRCTFSGTVTNKFSTAAYSGLIVGSNIGILSYCTGWGEVNGKGPALGGVAGGNSGTMSYCNSFATVTNSAAASSNYDTGGVVGTNVTAGKVISCYQYGTVTGNGNTIGAVVGASAGTVENCYYYDTNTSGTLYGIGGTADASGVVEAKTTAQFASGEVCYLLNGGNTTSAWYQNIDNGETPDAYPTVTGTAKVYKTSTGYSNYAEERYYIYDEEDLIAFRDVVNSGEVEANAELMADITLTADWTPIAGYVGTALYYYQGTFQGNGYTISNATVNITTMPSYVGFFGAIGESGEVKNLNLTSASMTKGGGMPYIGGITASNKGLLENCHYSGSVTSNASATVAIAGGIAGENTGTIRYCSANATVTAKAAVVGGIAGNNSTGTILGSYHIGAASGVTSSSSATGVGGIAGVTGDSAVVQDSYHIGAVTDSGDATAAYVGAIVGKDNGAEITNCYYNTETSDIYGIGQQTADTTGVTIAKTETQFASGEVCYLLNGSTSTGELVWYQDIDNEEATTNGVDASPMYEGGTVYLVGTNSYSNSAHTCSYENGFCTVCDGYQAAVLNTTSYDLNKDSNYDSVYEISNAGQLYWFVALVDGGETTANAILLRDIVINTGDVSGYTGTTVNAAWRTWEPIGDRIFSQGSYTDVLYAGFFEGNGKSVSGVYLDELEYADDTSYSGFFTYLSGGVVQNLSIKNSFFRKVHPGYPMQGAVLGAIVGEAASSAKILNCTSDATVYNEYTGTSTSTCYSGGIVGRVSSAITIENCHNTGAVTSIAGIAYSGGIVGNTVGATIRNCSNFGTISATKSGTASGPPAYCGGITAICTSSAVIERCYNTGTVWLKDTSSVSSVNMVGGLVGCQSGGTITWCYNTGEVRVDYTSATGTPNYRAGGLVGTMSANQSLTGCYNTGNVSVTGDAGTGTPYVGELVAYVASGGTITNAYSYDTEAELIGYQSGTASATDVITEADLASGKATYLLNGATSTGTLGWYQNLDNGETVDTTPKWQGGIVYAVPKYACDALTMTTVYTNTEAESITEEHTYQYAAEGSIISITCGNACDCGYHETVSLDWDMEVDLTYTSEAIEGLKVVCSDGLNAEDYTIVYTDNVNVGTAMGTLTVEGYEAQLTFEIIPATLTITAQDTTITYGDAPNGTGVSYAGFVGTENSGVLTGTLTYTSDYAQYGDIGSYLITPAGLTSTNYEILYVPGTLNVEALEIGIAWGETALSYIGEAQAPTATATGLVNGDTCTLEVEGQETLAGTGYVATVVSCSSANYTLPQTGLTTEFSVGADILESLDTLLEKVAAVDAETATTDDLADLERLLAELESFQTEKGSALGTEDATALAEAITKVEGIVDELNAEFVGKFVGHTLSLSGNIGVNFYMELADDVVMDEAAYMWFQVAGKETKVYVKDAVVDTEIVPGKTYYVFTCEVAAKEMTSTIAAQLVATKGSSESYDYTVKQYADYILANDYTAETKAVVKAMLNYGGHAQTHFAFNTEAMANADLTEDEKSLEAAEGIADFAFTETITLPEGLQYYGRSVLMKSETILRHYFTLEEGADIANYTFTVDGEAVDAAVKNEKYYYIDIKNIAAGQLDYAYEVKVTDGTTETAFSYCALHYVNAVVNGGSSSESMINVSKALYLYWEAAEAYFASVK